MTRFDDMFQHTLQSLLAQGQKRTLSPYPYSKSGSRAWLDFSSNDYLGLAAHPFLMESARIWAEKYGTGARSSRLVNGHLDVFEEVESRLALFKKVEKALVFSSGWQANASVVYSLLSWAREQQKSPPLVFTDRLNHASLHYGCRAAGVHQHRFRHNDIQHLEKCLKGAQDQQGMRFIFTETVFSMDGDQIDVQALVDLAERYHAFLYLDEAHATGLYGPRGRGLSSSSEGRVDLVMGTFSKALGGFGAYIGGSQALCDFLINTCSGFIHTTALPPAVWGAISAAISIVPTLEEERKALGKKAAFVRNALKEMGLDIGQSTTHIIPLIVGDAQTALACAAFLAEQGIRAVAIRPPSVPPHTSRIRFTLCADHTDEEIGLLCKAVKSMVKQGIIHVQG